VRNLHKHTRPIAGFVIRAFRPPVFHPLQNLKTPFQNTVRSPPPYISDKPNTAGIVFIFPAIKTLLGTLVRPRFTLVHTNSFSPPNTARIPESHGSRVKGFFQFTKKKLFMQEAKSNN
jgi:hypothetical protein